MGPKNLKLNSQQNQQHSHAQQQGQQQPSTTPTMVQPRPNAWGNNANNLQNNHHNHPKEPLLSMADQIARSASAPPTQVKEIDGVQNKAPGPAASNGGPGMSFGQSKWAAGGFWASQAANKEAAAAVSSPSAAQLFAPTILTNNSNTNSTNNSANGSRQQQLAWGTAMSPLRPNTTTPLTSSLNVGGGDMASPLRRNFDQSDYPGIAPGLVRPKSVNPSSLYQNHHHHQNAAAESARHDDEIRMKALLNAALDSREDLFEGPIPRAASTPPSRLQQFPMAGAVNNNNRFQSQGKEPHQDLGYQMQNMALNNEDHQNSNMRGRRNFASPSPQVQTHHQHSSQVYQHPHTTTNAHFPQHHDDHQNQHQNVTFSRDYEMYQMRQRAHDVYDQNAAFLQRPASAQGRFAGPAPVRYNSGSASAAAGHHIVIPPPGFNAGAAGNTTESMADLDPAMAQVLATLSATGNLTPQQLQQIQMQLRFSSPVANNSANRVPLQPAVAVRSPVSTSPTRVKEKRDGSPTSSASSPVRSAILEEFRNAKNKKYDIKDIVGFIVEFSGDQHGSRFIQQKLEVATEEERELVFVEILPHALALTTDVFGNYVIQKFFEYGSFDQKEELAKKMEGHILTLSLQMYGCRVVQKALEYVSAPFQAVLIKELEGHVLKCVKDQNGNHVIQKAIECIAPEKIRFIIDAFNGQVYVLATHPYGCRVIQRIFEHCNEKEIVPLLAELHKFCNSLIQDQYGNYVIQHILEKGKPADKAFVIGRVKGNVLVMSKHKFASNVVEKCVSYGSLLDRQEILDEVVTTKSDGTTALYTMIKDQFANYVVQKLLDVSDAPQRILLITKIKPQLPSLKKYTYGKHLINKVEKYLHEYKIQD